MRRRLPIGTAAAGNSTGAPPSGVFLATEEEFPGGLTGGVAAGRLQTPLRC